MSYPRRAWVGRSILYLVLTAALVPPSLAEPLPETSSAPTGFRDLGTGVAVFAAGREDGGVVVTDLWRTDGTAAGTFPLDACEGDCGYPTVVVATADGRAWFAAHRGGLQGPELYRTDGTPAGTVRLTDFGFDRRLNQFAASAYHWLAGRELLLFAVEDWDLGPELWITDGSRAGTRAIHRGPVGRRIDTATGAVAGGRLYFWLRRLDGGPEALWVSDGSAAGTREVVGSAGQNGAVAAAGATAVVALAPHGSECVNEVRAVSAGGGGVLLRRFTGAACAADPPSLLPVFGGVYFWSAAEGQLHYTDGTPAGTRQVTDFGAGRQHVGIFSPLAAGDAVVFLADDGVHGLEIWRHRAAEAEAVLLHETCPGTCLLGTRLEAVEGDAVYFTAGLASPGPRPWVVDAAGVRQLADVCPQCTTAPPVRLGDRLFFAGVGDGAEQELWVTDLRTAATRRLTRYAEPFAFGHDPRWGSLGGDLLFGADDGLHGSEPWVSDGTAAGTRLLADLVGSDLTPTGPPGVPPGLAVHVIGEDALEITWDAAAGAQHYQLDLRAPVDLAPTFGDGRTAYLTGLAPGTPLTVRVRAVNAFGASPYGEAVSAMTLSRPRGEPCVDGGTTLCLRQGRFRVEVAWRDQHNGGHGSGKALRAAGSDRSGYFWFFKPDNVELIVKLLDGSQVNGFWWTFFGALSDVEYWVTVTDTVSSAARTYHNPPGQVCGRGDTASLAPVRVPAESVVHRPVSDPEAPPPAVQVPGAAAAAATVAGEACVADAATLCLLEGRFRVRVAWHDQHNDRDGHGAAAPFTDRTGFFTFFNAENVELVVKALDGRPVNGRYWFFYGALSDVEYAITVEDLVSGVSERYVNTPGNICGRADTLRFPGDPSQE